jgi:outer membrane protein
MLRNVSLHARLAAAAASLVVFGPAAASAAPLTLPDCLRMALDRNRSLRAASEDVQRSRAGVHEAVAGYLPTLGAQAQVTAAENVTRLQFPDILTGKTMEVEADLTPNYVVEVTASQPIYTFGRLSNRYRQSRETLNFARHTFAQTTDEVLYSVTEAYYTYLAARDLSDVSEQALSEAETHARAVAARFETGQASAFDRLRAEVRAQNMRPDVASAHRARDTALLTLKRLLGVPLSDSLAIAGTLETPAEEIPLETALATARARRSDLAARRDQEAIADASVRLARSSDNPQLAVEASYNLYAFDLQGNPLSSDPWDNSYQANVVLQWPFFDGFATHARVTEARAARVQARTAREDLEESVAFEVRQAHLALDESREVVESQDSNRHEAADALRMAEQSYDEGLVSSLDVQDAELALNQARTNYTRALADYHIAEARLRKAMGTIADQP